MDRRSFIRNSALLTLGLAGCGTTRGTSSVSTAPSKADATTTAAPQPKYDVVTGGTPGVASFVQRANSATQIAFTFHGGGSSSLAQSMLSTLKTLQVPVTIFAIGQWLEQNNGLAQQIVGDGHELANHTYSHPSFNSLTGDQMYNEIIECRSVLLKETNSPGRWFRPSSEDAVPPQMVLTESDKAGYPVVVGFDVDPVDYDEPGAPAIISRVGAKITGGSIVSLHFGHSGTIEAMAGLVTLVKSRNLKPVTVSQLLS